MSVLPGAEPFEFHPERGADAPPPVGVVLCHGFTGTPQSMRAWGEHLRDAGFTVCCPLLPGHGTRWQDMNRTTWADWYAELERAFDALRATVDGPVFAMGQSMGGTLVTRLAQQRGAEVAGLVLVNPSYLTMRRDAFLLPAMSRLVPSFPGIANDIKKPGSTELAYARIPLKAANSLQQLWRTVRSDLNSVDVPIRMYRSVDDHVVEAQNGAVLLEGVASAEVEEILLTDSYHVATLDNEAERIFAGSVEFVTARLSGPRAPDAAR